jgi:sugar transferase EpsL
MYLIAKRSLDIVIAFLAGLVALPIVIVVGILLWCAQRTVLFRQMRPGLHGRPFMLYKFCSMSEDRDASGRLLPDDQRITRVGSIVRSLSLDELPQLWNVIKGDMSLVGPRPLLMEYLDRYTPEQARRHDVMPGITGWTQINGRNALSWDEKFDLDLWYVDNRSFLLDLRILGMTALRVLRRSGISSPGHATMERFSGSNRDA